MLVITKLFVIILNLISYTNAANVLGIFNHADRNHFILGHSLLKNLLSKGHNITMVSPFKLDENIQNYTNIYLNGVLERQLEKQTLDHNVFDGYSEAMELARIQTEATISNTKLQQLVASGTKFDLILMDWYMNYALLVYADIFKAPVILITTESCTNILSRILGNPTPPSYVQSNLLPLSSNMDFYERTINGLIYIVQNIFENIDISYHESLLKEYFSNTTSLSDYYKYIALVFSLNHYSMEPTRPTVPNLISIAGFHISTPKNLTGELKEIMDNSSDGVIYFNLDSSKKLPVLSDFTHQDILRAFSKVKQTVVWKSNKKPAQKIFQNVYFVENFVADNDILAHPNLKLFIGHCDQLNIIETVYYSIPIIGIPLYGDQKTNIAQAVSAGYALKIDLINLNEQNVFWAVKEILSNPKYKENVRKRSSLLRDQPISPMENAMFWIEHVLKHNGAEHLRINGTHLSWYQYFLLDVILLVTIVLVIILLLLYFIVKQIICIGLMFFEKEKLE